MEIGDKYVRVIAPQLASRIRIAPSVAQDTDDWGNSSNGMWIQGGPIWINTSQDDEYLAQAPDAVLQNVSGTMSESLLLSMAKQGVSLRGSNATRSWRLAIPQAQLDAIRSTLTKSGLTLSRG